MVERKFKNLAVFGVFVLMICLAHCEELNSNENEARRFLNQTSDKIFKFFDELVDKEHYFDVDTQRNQYKTNQVYINFVNKIVEDTKKFDFKNFHNKKLKYAFKKLVKLADENIIGVNRYSRILESLKELEYLSQYKEINKYLNMETRLAFYPDVLKIIEESDDDKEVQHYWSEWRILTGKWAQENLILSVEGIKDAANLSELSPLEFWSRGFNITDMDDFMLEIQPLYKEFHAFIRNQLRLKFGAAVIDSDGLIPDHLYQQIKLQIMTNHSIIEDLYSYESLPKTDTAISESFYAKDFYIVAERLYKDLGFGKLPSAVWENRIKLFKHADDYEDNEDDDEYDEACQTRVNYRTPNIYLEFCQNRNFSYLLESFINMGYVYYAKEMEGLPAYFFSAPQSLDYAMGKAMILSASTHQFLESNGLFVNVDVTRRSERNRLLRIAMSRLLYLPMDYVHSKVMADLLSGKVKIEDLNGYYWDLMSEYAGVKKPVGHVNGTYDMPYDFYKQMNGNQMSREFTAEILSYQIHKELCELKGEYPSKPLHECDIEEDKDAGDALKKMMRLGSSKPFYQVLASMFPDNPKITTEGILEYYNPLKIMLHKRNKKANLRLGWSTSPSY